MTVTVLFNSALFDFQFHLIPVSSTKLYFYILSVVLGILDLLYRVELMFL